MIRIFRILAFGFLLGLSANAQIEDVSEPIQAGTWHRFISSVMEEKRLFAVRLPGEYAENSDRSYPVIYVLDGDEHRLRAIGGMVDALSRDILEEQIPDAIVVAVPNTNRTRDLTPTHTLIEFGTEENSELAQSGGGPKFLRFFAEEFIPAIDATYRTGKRRIIVGESFGGLLAAHALLKQPDLFTHYLIIDATYIWDNGYLTREIAQQENVSAKAYFALANNDAFGEIGQTNRRWGRAFADRVGALGGKVSIQYFEDETHGTIALPAWYYGLRFLLGTETDIEQ